MISGAKPSSSPTCSTAPHERSGGLSSPTAPVHREPISLQQNPCERQILRPILSEDGDGAHPLDGAGSRFGHAGDDADKGGFARTVPPDQSDALGADREGQIAKEDLVFRCLS